MTSNSPMGVHHGWGRTYKDIHCCYKAMKGSVQRWENNFEGQGLVAESRG